MLGFLDIQFNTPSHLWGLSLVLIPVIIHLFSFRNFKKVVVSDVSVLESITNTGVARKKIKELLVLFTRVLSIVFLVFAFSDPTSRSDKSGQERSTLVNIYLDNSYSMSRQTNGRELLNQAKLAAEKVVDSYSINDRFRVQTDDFSPSKNRTWQVKEVKNKLANVGLSWNQSNFRLLVSSFVQNKALANEYHVVNYLISDFNYDIALDDLLLLEDQLHFFSVRSQQDANIYLDSVWFAFPERKIQGYDSLCFSIVNRGTQDLPQFPVRLLLNGQDQLTAVDLPAQKRVKSFFRYKVPNAPIVFGEVSIDEPVLAFDNKMFFSYQVPKKINLLVVSESQEFIGVIDKLLRKEPQVNYQVISPLEINYKNLGQYNLVVLGELDEISMSMKAWLTYVYRNERTQIVVVPSSQIDLESYNNFGREVQEYELSSLDSSYIELAPVSKKNDFFHDVFNDSEVKSNLKVGMPKLIRHHQVRTARGVPVLRKNNGDPYLIKSEKLMLFSSGITDQSSDFSRHPLIVPVLLKIAFSSVLLKKIYLTKGETSSFKSKLSWGDDYFFRAPDSSVFQARLKNNITGSVSLGPNFSEPGFYEVLVQDSLVGAVAVNQSRMESLSQDTSLSELRKFAVEKNHVTFSEYLPDASTQTFRHSNLSSYWQISLGLAAFFMLLEMLLIRFGRAKSSGMK